VTPRHGIVAVGAPVDVTAVVARRDRFATDHAGPLVDSAAMSAGRIAMWLISGLIVVAVVAVLAGPGYDGVPGHWVGLVVAASFVAISFALGLYE
jgi:hypothetical protein